jgi:hypothetical protein
LHPTVDDLSNGTVVNYPQFKQVVGGKIGAKQLQIVDGAMASSYKQWGKTIGNYN